MKKFLYSLLPYIFELFCCIIYSFMMSGIVLCSFSLDFCYFEKLFFIFLFSSYLCPLPFSFNKFLWR